MGSVKNSSSNPNSHSASIMTSPQNINTGTVAPIIVNPESILVDSDLEEDLKQIQWEAAAEQRRIEEESQARVAAAHECNEKKHQEQKAKEEEEEKLKEEEDKVIRDKALEEAQKQQLKVSC